MTYTYWANQLESMQNYIPEELHPTESNHTDGEQDFQEIAKLYDIRTSDAQDILTFIGCLIGDEEYQRNIDNLNSQPKKTIEIPSVYSIPKKVKDQYAASGINLIHKKRHG